MLPQSLDELVVVVLAQQVRVLAHQVRVVEHLYRWSNWNITQKSAEFTKKDAQTIEFNVTLQPDEERAITYRVRYEWK